MTSKEILNLEAGDYLARYDGEPDPGSRCGFSDTELSNIRTCLAQRDLTIQADDCGLHIVELT